MSRSPRPRHRANLMSGATRGRRRPRLAVVSLVADRRPSVIARDSRPRAAGHRPGTGSHRHGRRTRRSGR
ncbi:hypothetical protein FMEAI12_5410002 [Parafrankia sp. Ea1.12]|nr:hypothetical protein FMEAI12_5410002 [Parafrankia sp. Ea1.12]